MKRIEIDDEFEDTEDFVYCLQEIIRQIENGCTSGIEPTWCFEEVEQ